jgi:hypothetical protein
MSKASSVLARGDCRVGFGSRTSVDEGQGVPRLCVALPVLAGKEEERLLAEPAEPFQRQMYTLFQNGSWLAGFAIAAAGIDLEFAAGQLYQGLFAVTAGLHLYRIWNYVPQINAVTEGLENYRRFCRGRSLAFEKQFGRDFQRRLPAGSAVGSNLGPLAVAFIAGRTAPSHFENPRQVPAFEYPPAYGPRPPSFSRATVVMTEQGRQIFVSGTAAIRGHATVAAADLEAQLGCTCENLLLIGKAAGAGPDFGAGNWRRTFKIYIRHPEDLVRVRARLEREFLRPEDVVSYLQADICRSDLLVEIEAALMEPR